MSARLNNPSATEIVQALVARARAAQERYQRCTQEQVDEVVTAAGWAIMKPENNRVLAELAVADTGLGNAQDKFDKNYRKTLGLLRDLKGAKSVGVIAEYPQLGTGGNRPAGRRGGGHHALDQSRRDAGEQDHQRAQGPQRRHPRAVAQGPFAPARKLLEFIHAEFGKIGAPADLVQHLPAPVTKDLTHELMRQADLVAATGSQANIRAAYSSGTPGVRRRRGQRGGDRRRQRRPRRRGGARSRARRPSTTPPAAPRRTAP